MQVADFPTWYYSAWDYSTWY